MTVVVDSTGANDKEKTILVVSPKKDEDSVDSARLNSLMVRVVSSSVVAVVLSLTTSRPSI